jgi:hypothetical protein
MATTTATITLSSSDLTGDSLSLSTTTNLNKAGTLTGLDQTTGVSRMIIAAASTTKIIADADDYASGPAKNHKVYVKMLSTVATEYVTLTVDSQEIGRLYGGDFAFIPFSNSDGTHDVKVTTPSGQTNTSVEYIVIHQA